MNPRRWVGGVPIRALRGKVALTISLVVEMQNHETFFLAVGSILSTMTEYAEQRLNRLVPKISLPNMQMGNVCVRRFKITPREELKFRMRAAMQNLPRFLRQGRHHQLWRDDTLLASDGHDERAECAHFVLRANRDVLILGLNLGVVANAAAQRNGVRSVTVVEPDRNIIGMIRPFMPYKVDIVHDDPWTWRPPRGVRYTMAWHDLWHDIDIAQAAERRELQVRYRRWCEWQDGWGSASVDRLMIALRRGIRVAAVGGKPGRI